MSYIVYSVRHINSKSLRQITPLSYPGEILLRRRLLSLLKFKACSSPERNKNFTRRSKHRLTLALLEHCRINCSQSNVTLKALSESFSHGSFQCDIAIRFL
ncbi:uncharacterized protein Gasu_16280 [Galdieria sulphuraria]|uniref:Uncharacterized protein n=1 Tax=Galdieria sulphuraria TaxID=130081 RepID=M2W5S5_GALSU|nr:uncharacterized protein Gasu_16280 [Galdieria sulphuraria]EME31131.1 hypothetical protein Gasu_16280 [Galdieria sulphuraria]|eukprot:XP_005707651.1 hypothetical protein Gasu_16280 [Galdieria sulphuraria]